MYPILFKIGGFELHTYGVFLASAFAVGFIFAVRRGKAYGYTFDEIYNTTVVIIISSIIGARFAYVIFHLDEFQGRWLDIINPVQSTGQIGIAGMVVLGGVIGAISAGYWYLRYKKVSFGKMADTMAPSLALGLAVGRIGCFFNGCCFGKECHLPWGITFPEGSMPHYIYGDIPIHPTQIYAIISNLLVFFILLRSDRIKKFDGFTFALFTALYGFFRFIIESLRYYDGYESGMIIIDLPGFEITFSQTVSIFMVAAGIIFIIIGNRRNKLAKQ